MHGCHLLFLRLHKPQHVPMIPLQLDSPLSTLDVLDDPYPRSITKSETPCHRQLVLAMISQDQASMCLWLDFPPLYANPWHKLSPRQTEICGYIGRKGGLWKIYCKDLNIYFLPCLRYRRSMWKNYKWEEVLVYLYYRLDKLVTWPFHYYVSPPPSSFGDYNEVIMNLV